MESIPFIQWCLENLNYYTIFILMVIESSFLPFPSEIVIPPAAYIAAGGGGLNLVAVIIVGTLGAVCGGLINYYLAILLGRPLVYRFAESRIGALFLLDREKVAKAELFFVKNGGVATFIGRLVPGIRQLISIPAGLAKMKLVPFILYTALGAGIWNTVLAMLGWFLQRTIPYDQLNGVVSKYSHEIGLGIIIVVVLALGYVIIRASRRPKLEPPEE